MSSMPEVIDGRYEVYRVVLDYEGMFDGFWDRIDDLNTTLEQIEMNGGFAKGVAQKLLCRSKGRSSRTFGWESLGKMLKGTGLALVLVVDDARFAPLKEQMIRRRRARPSIVGPSKPKWLFTPKKASKLRKKWWDSLTAAQQKKHHRKSGRASAAARRRKAMESIATAALRALKAGSSSAERNACTPAMAAIGTANGSE